MLCSVARPAIAQTLADGGFAQLQSHCGHCTCIVLNEFCYEEISAEGIVLLHILTDGVIVDDKLLLLVFSGNLYLLVATIEVNVIQDRGHASLTVLTVLFVLAAFVALFSLFCLIV